MTGWEDDSHGIVQKIKFDHTNGISTNQHLSWKFKDSKKRDKHLDLAKELKKLWNMKVTVIPIVIGMLGIVTKRLAERLEENEWRPSKLQHYQDRSEYWEEPWRLKEICCHSNPCEKSSANAGVKNSQKSKIIMMIIIIHIQENVSATLKKQTYSNG